MKNEDNLVAVEPAEPLASIYGAEWPPKLKQGCVTPAERGERWGGGGKRTDRWRENAFISAVVPQTSCTLCGT